MDQSYLWLHPQFTTPLKLIIPFMYIKYKYLNTNEKKFVNNILYILLGWVTSDSK